MAAMFRVLVTVVVVIAIAAPGRPATSEKPAEPIVTAVFSNVFNGYQRTRLPDGKFKPETYTFGDGGRRNAGVPDASFDNLPFVRIAQTLTGPLAARGYHQSTDPKNIDLLIMVYYGCTAGTERGASSAAYQGLSDAMNASRYDRITPAFPPPAGSPDGLPTPQSTAESQLEGLLMMVGIENRIREDINYRNARLLGYHDALVATDTIAQYAGQGDYRRDLLSDVEEDRYYVILVACDFRVARQQKALRPLWSTRFNVRARGNTFTDALPTMARFAARYFGQSSGGLMREAVPVGQVEIKDLIDLGEAKDSKK
jgi:hypothetical protein